MLERKTKPQFITEKTIRALYYEITPAQFLTLRRILPPKIFWVQTVKRGHILWDWDLLQDFMHRCDSPENQERVAAYIASLEPTTPPSETHDS